MLYHSMNLNDIEEIKMVNVMRFGSIDDFMYFVNKNNSYGEFGDHHFFW